jgi:hypothetical protein
MYIEPEDIVERLVYRGIRWYKGVPRIEIEGDDKTFGFIVFEYKDNTVKLRVYITDKVEIKRVAEEAINNFSDLCLKIWDG